MKSMKIVVCGILFVALASVAAAAGFEAGSNLLSFQLNEGVADLYYSPAAGYITAYDHSEVGGQVQFWHFFTNEYAFNLTAGIGYFKETDAPGTGAPAGSTDMVYSQTSWQVRVGGDRVARINDRFHVFVGPGIQYWSGKAKTEGGTGPTPPAALESENVTRIALEGRIGVHMKWTDKVGGFLQLGHYIGYASADDAGAKATWWPSGHDGAAGVAVSF